ncbi:caspase domain protein [mine drainage metagenome]|uniref:Caspase domain protein n=1 Tax=mine drainage metagenome TaxID=410659 RepID=A0A1J5TM00_9ZZZZ
MFFRFVILILAIAAMLSGCAEVTPQIKLSNSKISMGVRNSVTLVTAVDYSADGNIVVTGSYDGTVNLWSVKNARRLAQFKGCTHPVTSVAYSPDGKMIAIACTGAAASGNNETFLLNPVSGEVIGRIDDIGGKLSFTSDGRFILGSVGGRGNELKLWDVQGSREVRSFNYPHGEVGGSVSPDGKYVVAWGLEDEGMLMPSFTYTVSMFATDTGREIWHKAWDSIWTEKVTRGGAVFSPDGGRVLVAFNRKPGLLAGVETSFGLYATVTGKRIREIGRTSYPSTISLDLIYNEVAAFKFLPDGNSFLSGDLGGHYRQWSISDDELIREFSNAQESNGVVDRATTNLMSSPFISVSPDGRVAVTNSLAAARIYNIENGKEVATLIGFADGEWLITTPSGYYNSSAKGDQYLDVRVGGKPYSVSQLRESFYRPDLVKLALAGNTLDGYRKVADIKQPPAISIVDTPASVTTDQVTLSLQVKDQGGGMGDVRLYRNGTAVVLEKTRNLQAVSNSADGQVLHYTVSLELGKNTIKAIVFNGDNTMQSSSATIDIDAKIAARKPALYAVVVGIQNFLNPRLDLSYSVADAKLFADTLEQHGKGLYSDIRVKKLLTQAETSKEAIVAALAEARKEVKPEDLFVFYVASHGTIDDGQYLLITSNVGSTNYTKLKQEALSQDKLKDMISNISASKKLVVLDTCDAGKMGDALQVALLTRGMSDDTAMNILSRAVGSTILSAATSDQEAVEGYKGHGLFTYVVSQGLAGEADANHDGFVKTLELADYVDSTVPELAMDVFKHRQYPIVSPTGEGFPLVKVGK